MSKPEKFIPTRQSLLSRLKNWEDQESWRAFFDTYWKLIYNSAIRAGLTDAEAQDVVQETVSAVCKKMPEFTYDPARGSFKAWLMKQTGWRIADQFRKRMPIQASRRSPETSTRTATVARVADPAVPELDLMWEAEWEKTLLEAAMQRLKRKVDPKYFQVFDLCVRKRWPIAKVARDLKMSSARVYLAKHRVGKLLKREVQCMQTKPL